MQLIKTSYSLCESNLYTMAHPFDPITPAEIQLAVRILEASFPGASLRYKRIDVQEPIKKDVIPYIEAERLRQPLPPKPARIIMAYFTRWDTGAFHKTLINADTKSVVYAKQLPKEVQVSYEPSLSILLRLY